jgi:putative PIN family toxin of toxin-antitoxin system
MKVLVLDTNIVLDLFVFDDPAVRGLQLALQSGAVQWLATSAMREELARVLDYPKISTLLTRNQISAGEVMAQFDGLARIHSQPVVASVVCSDGDDQKFIDLAVAHRAELISKDEAVLGLAKALTALGLAVGSVWQP